MDKINGISENITVIQPSRGIKDYAVGIHVRVSKNHKGQMDSLAIQASGLTKLAPAHSTWFVADIFIDVVSTKTDSYRSEFSRMISVCENESIDIILTKSIS